MLKYLLSEAVQRHYLSVGFVEAAKIQRLRLFAGVAMIRRDPQSVDSVEFAKTQIFHQSAGVAKIQRCCSSAEAAKKTRTLRQSVGSAESARTRKVQDLYWQEQEMSAQSLQIRRGCWAWTGCSTYCRKDWPF